MTDRHLSERAVLDAIDGIADTNAFGIRRPHEMRTVFRDVVRALPTARGEVALRLAKALDRATQETSAAFDEAWAPEIATAREMLTEASRAAPVAEEPSFPPFGTAVRVDMEAPGAPAPAAGAGEVEGLLRRADVFTKQAAVNSATGLLVSELAAALRSSEAARVRAEALLSECRETFATALRASEAKRVEVERLNAGYLRDCEAAKSRALEQAKDLDTERAAHAETRKRLACSDDDRHILAAERDAARAEAEAEREALRAEVAAEKRAHLRSREWLDHHAIQFARIRAVCGMHDESEETVEEAVENLAEERNALEVERDAATTEAATLRAKLEAAERDNVRHVMLLAQTANAFSIADEPSSFEAIPGKVRALKKRDEQRARAEAAQRTILRVCWQWRARAKRAEARLKELQAMADAMVRM